MGFHTSLNVSNFATEKETEKISNRIMAQIKVNGEIQVVELPLNVSELIKLNNVEQPEMVSVQVNEEFVDRDEWNSIQLKENDEVDFLYFMGGGAI
jgi:sulfur carrier protein